MMKMKKGFTLAEVLITLAIIGVVAAMTLPSLMINTGEQQAMTAYKKIINTLSESGQLNAAVLGFDYSTITGAGAYNDDYTKDGKQTLGAIIHEQMNVTPGLGAVSLGSQSNCAVLIDSTAICLGSYAAVGGTDAKSIVVDTNGTKGPNMLASCGEDGCTTKASRKLYDQYYVTLYRGTAYPGKWTALDTNGTTGQDYAALYAAGVDKKKTATTGN